MQRVPMFFLSLRRRQLAYVYIEVGQLLTAAVKHFYLIQCQECYLTAARIYAKKTYVSDYYVKMKNRKPRNTLDNVRSMPIVAFDIRFRQIL